MSLTISQFLMLAIVPIMSPGPAVLLTLSNTMHFGARAGLLSATGNGAAVIAIGLLVGVGLGNTFNLSPRAVTAIQSVSAVYLLYLGYRLTIEDWRRVVRPKRTQARSGRVAFANSLFLGLSNPVGAIFFAAAMPLFLDRDADIFHQTLVLVLSYGLACTAYHSALVFFCNSVRGHFQRPRTAIAIRRCTGVLFIALSVFVSRMQYVRLHIR